MCQCEGSCAQADEGMCDCMSQEQSPKGRMGAFQASATGAWAVPLPSGQAPAKRRPSRGTRAIQDGKQGELDLDSGISTNASSRAASVTNSTSCSMSRDWSRDSSVDHLHDTRAGLRALRQTIQRRRSYEKAPCHTVLDHCVEVGKNNWSLQFADSDRSGNAQTLKQEELRKVTREMLQAKTNSVEARELASRLEELKLQVVDQSMHGRPPLPRTKQHLESPRLSRPRELPALLSPPQLKHAEMYGAEVFDTKKCGSTRIDNLKGSMTPRW